MTPSTLAATVNKQNGSDPVIEVLMQVLNRLSDMEDKMDEVVEKLNDLTLTANEGFSFAEPES